MPEVLSRSGIPIVSDFASGKGTPLVVNETTGRGYVLIGNAVVPLNGDGIFNLYDYDSIESCLDAAEAAGGGLVVASATTYSYATSPNFARPGVSIYAYPGAIFNHTGSGEAFLLDGGSSGSGILGNRYDNITVQGNANSTNGIYVRALHHSIFTRPRVMGCSTSGAGIRVDWGVGNEWNTPIVSVNTGALSPIPKYGLYLSRRSGTDHTTAQLVKNPIFEGLTQANGAGIYIDYAAANEFTGGTSESNTNGVIITGDSGTGNNRFSELFMENNTTADIQLQTGCVYQSFYEITSGGLIDIQGNANRNRFVGGVLADTTIGASTAHNRFAWVTFSSGSTLTDASPSTQYFESTGPNGSILTSLVNGAWSSRMEGLVYSGSLAIDASLGNTFAVTGTNGVDFDVLDPTNPKQGQHVTFTIRNGSGGVMGAPVFGGAYKIGAAWTKPANGFSRSIGFYYNGTNWIETWRSQADVSN